MPRSMSKKPSRDYRQSSETRPTSGLEIEDKRSFGTRADDRLTFGKDTSTTRTDMPSGRSRIRSPSPAKKVFVSEQKARPRVREAVATDARTPFRTIRDSPFRMSTPASRNNSKADWAIPHVYNDRKTRDDYRPLRKEAETDSERVRNQQSLNDRRPSHAADSMSRFDRTPHERFSGGYESGSMRRTPIPPPMDMPTRLLSSLGDRLRNFEKHEDGARYGKGDVATGYRGDRAIANTREVIKNDMPERSGPNMDRRPGSSRSAVPSGHELSSRRDSYQEQRREIATNLPAISVHSQQYKVSEEVARGYDRRRSSSPISNRWKPQDEQDKQCLQYIERRNPPSRSDSLSRFNRRDLARDGPVAISDRLGVRPDAGRGYPERKRSITFAERRDANTERTRSPSVANNGARPQERGSRSESLSRLHRRDTARDEPVGISERLGVRPDAGRGYPDGRNSIDAFAGRRDANPERARSPSLARNGVRQQERGSRTERQDMARDEPVGISERLGVRPDVGRGYTDRRRSIDAFAERRDANSERARTPSVAHNGVRQQERGSRAESLSRLHRRDIARDEPVGISERLGVRPDAGRGYPDRRRSIEAFSERRDANPERAPSPSVANSGVRQQESSKESGERQRDVRREESNVRPAPLVNDARKTRERSTHEQRDGRREEVPSSIAYPRSAASRSPVRSLKPLTRQRSRSPSRGRQSTFTRSRTCTEEGKGFVNDYSNMFSNYRSPISSRLPSRPESLCGARTRTTTGTGWQCSGRTSRKGSAGPSSEGGWRKRDDDEPSTLTRNDDVRRAEDVGAAAPEKKRAVQPPNTRAVNQQDRGDEKRMSKVSELREFFDARLQELRDLADESDHGSGESNRMTVSELAHLIGLVPSAVKVSERYTRKVYDANMVIANLAGLASRAEEILATGKEAEVGSGRSAGKGKVDGGGDNISDVLSTGRGVSTGEGSKEERESRKIRLFKKEVAKHVVSALKPSYFGDRMGTKDQFKNVSKAFTDQLMDLYTFSDDPVVDWKSGAEGNLLRVVCSEALPEVVRNFVNERLSVVELMNKKPFNDDDDDDETRFGFGWSSRSREGEQWGETGSAVSSIDFSADSRTAFPGHG